MWFTVVPLLTCVRWYVCLLLYVVVVLLFMYDDLCGVFVVVGFLVCCRQRDDPTGCSGVYDQSI